MSELLPAETESRRDLICDCFADDGSVWGPACENFDDDDTGFCMACGHHHACHEREAK